MRGGPSSTIERMHRCRREVIGGQAPWSWHASIVSPPRVVSSAHGLTTDATAALDGQQTAINVQLGERTRGPLDEGGRGDGSDAA